MKQPFVLLVDDDADDRAWFLEALFSVNKHINCAIAADGCEALEVLSRAERLPDYIFLDINMPRMNGKECLKRIRSDVRFADITVVIYSTSCHPGEIAEVKSLGAQFYVTKPVNPERIKISLYQIFKNAPSQRIKDPMVVLL